MPFAAVGVGAAIVSAGFTLFGTAAAGTAFLATWVGGATVLAINIGVSVGISMISSALFNPSVDPSGSVGRSTQLNLQIGSSIPRQLALGTCATSGSLTYWQLSGNENHILDLVFTLADWPCDKLLGIFISGIRHKLLIQADGSYLVSNDIIGSAVIGNVVSTAATKFDNYSSSSSTTIISDRHDYVDKLRITFHRGDFNQLHDTGLIDRSGGVLDSTFRGRGCCYVVVTLVNDTYNATSQGAIDNSVFPNGIPKFMFEIQGAKLYDFRKDSSVIGGSGTHRWDDVSTWEYTDNPVLAYYNWRRGLWYNNIKLYGLTNSFASLDLLTYIAAANVCDEVIPSLDYLNANGGNTIYTKRYTCNGVSVMDSDKSTLLKDLSMCMSSDEVEVGGLFKLYAGSSRSISANLSRDDTIIDTAYKYVSKLPSNELVNSIFGEYHSLLENYQVVSLPNRVDPQDILADGMRHEIKYRYGLVTNPEQAQRLMEIKRKTERFQATIQCTFDSSAAALEPGDWITYSDSRKGWNNKVFLILAIPKSNPVEVVVSMREIDASVYVWGKEEFIAKSEIGRVRYVQPPISKVAALAVVPILFESSDQSTQRPALRLTWTPISDITIKSVIFEYKIQNSILPPLSTTTNLPSSGSFVIINGIVSNSQYEVRALITTVPNRITEWTGWVSASASSGSVIVPIGNVSISVPPNSISEIELTEQERYMLNLGNTIADGLGTDFQLGSPDVDHDENGVISMLEDYEGWEQQEQYVELLVLETNNAKASIKEEKLIRIDENAALAQTLNETSAELTITNQTATQLAATVTAETSARVLGDQQLASQISTVQTTTGNLSSSVSAAQTSINAIESKYAVTVSNNGVVTGIVQIGTNAGSSAFNVSVDDFIISSIDGGNSTSIFRLDTTTNPARIVFNGDFFTSGQISGDAINANTLSSITANMGTVTAGKIQSTNGNMLIDLDAGFIKIGVV